MRAIVVHGGCEDRNISDQEKQQRLEGAKKACEAGYEALQRTDSALEAVEAAIHYLEDDPVFDAGTGSYYNLFGDVEMDALIMESTGRAGGVACIQRVQHPISVARKVMEETPHVLLVGEGARLFARAYDFPEYDPGSEQAKQLLQEQFARVPSAMRTLMDRYSKIRANQKSYSTVGAVAIDSSGLIVAGTSTGGIPQKLPGRMGDSAIIGAGTFASTIGGASATGLGEGIIRVGVTRKVIERLSRGVDVATACRELVAICKDREIPCGVIALDKEGRVGACDNGYVMPAYYCSEETGESVRVNT